MTPYRLEYIARFNRVLDYIDQHLDEELTLDTLAAVACFSPFHFHRLFSAWHGATLAEYVRRRRLELAAARLYYRPHESVLDIALASGFGSGESFCRAFKKHFACAPSTWRNRKPDQVLNHFGRDNAGIKREGLPMKVNVSSQPAVHLAYLRQTGPYGPAIPQLWSRFGAWTIENQLSLAPRYGLSLDDPSITPAASCRYDAACEVGADFIAKGEIATRVLPGGLYARLDFVGTPDECREAWQQLMRDWLPDSGFQLDELPCFEHYLPTDFWDQATGRFGCRLCLPVRPL